MSAGAPLLNVPHVRTRKELDTVVRASRFAPHGTRGLCPAARYNAFGAGNLDTVRTVANEHASIIPILEDKECLDHLDDDRPPPVEPLPNGTSLADAPQRGAGGRFDGGARTVERGCVHHYMVGAEHLQVATVIAGRKVGRPRSDTVDRRWRRVAFSNAPTAQPRLSTHESQANATHHRTSVGADLDADG